MGVGLYLQNYRSTSGLCQLQLKARHKGLSFTKQVGIKVNPEQWDSRNYRVKGGIPAINDKLGKIRETMLSSWELYETGVYTWEELVRRLSGGNTKTDVVSFIEDVYKSEKSPATYQAYLNCIRAYKSVLQLPVLEFSHVTYPNTSQAVRRWKEKSLSAATINTYITHLGSVVNEAYRRGLAAEPFIKHKTYRQKKKTVVIKTATPDSIREGISKVKDLYDFQTIALYLLQFCLRGMYTSDLATMHLHTTENESEWDANRYVNHKRHKTGELMQILYSCEPTEAILSSLRNTFRITHKNTPDRLPKPSENLQLLQYDYTDYRVHKNVWDVYAKRSTKLIGMPFKTARKTFETVALMLDVSQPVRYRLLGHVDQSIKRSYTNWEWDKLREKVDEAHIRVLEEFECTALWQELRQSILVTGLVTASQLDSIDLTN